MTGTTLTLLLIKASLLLGATLMVVCVLRRDAAARRHRVWSAAFVALVALPLLVVALPALHVPIPAWRAADATPAAKIDPRVDLGAARIASAPVLVSEPAARMRADAPAPTSFRVPSIRESILGAWALGVVAALVALIVSLVRVRRLERSGSELKGEWEALAARIAAQLGFNGPVRVVAAPSVVTPMAGGVMRATVFVPMSATEWNDELREIVLAHEIAHLASRDPLRHLVSRVAFTLYWFHPLVWLAARKAASDCEQACDEAVLSLGIRPSTYARVLLDFASVAPLGTPSVALPMVKRAPLENRLMAILSNPPRPSTRRRALVPSVAAIAATLSIAAVQPSAAPAPVVHTSASEPTSIERAPTNGANTKKPRVLAVSQVASPVPFERRESACWADGNDNRSFNGSLSMSDRGGRTVIHEQIGYRGGDRVIQKSFGDLRVCALAEGYGGDFEARPSQWPARAPHVILETQQSGDVRRLEIVGGRMTWTVNGTARPLDAGGESWRDALLAVLDLTWDVSHLRGQVSSLRGEISSIRGNRSSLLGEISSLRGHVSSLRGQISSARGEESSLRGEISSIRGHVSSLRGSISSARGAISSLQSSRWDGVDRTDRIRQYEDQIRRIEAEIERYNADEKVREVERRIAALDTEGRVAAIEREIRDFDLEEKIEAVNRRLAELDVDGRVAGVEKQIDGLDAGRRVLDLEVRRDQAVSRLRNVLK
jgi:beta-lactamase regulating signal transducer with metallopeptidase domain/predicted  nucleic acid-binding Zn-ribbon protein